MLASNGGDDGSLWSAQFGFDPLAIFDDSSLQLLPDESQEVAVGDPVLQEFEHPVVVDGVKVRADVGVQYPSNLPGLYSHPDRVECVVLPAPRPESVRCITGANSGNLPSAGESPPARRQGQTPLPAGNRHRYTHVHAC